MQKEYRTKLTEDEVLRIEQLDLQEFSPTRISQITNIPRTTVRRVLKAVEENEIIVYADQPSDHRFGVTTADSAKVVGIGIEAEDKEEVTTEYRITNATINDAYLGHTGPAEPEVDQDQELIEENLRLAKRLQRIQDTQRIERKAFREHVRVDSAIQQLTESLYEALEKKLFDFDTTKWEVQEGNKAVGVIHFTDHHLNELVKDLDTNEFDIHIASKRIQKHVVKSKKWFKAHGIDNVLIAMTGDMVKNNQFLSEITEMSMARANAVFIAVEIYSQVILDLNKNGFNVSVASVIGNESRMMERFDTTDFLASDSFDLMIHKTLYLMMKDKPGVTIIPMSNPLECVVNVAGSNLLLVHGNAHGNLANTGTLEKSSNILKARYASAGIKIDYVVLGHQHSPYINSGVARGASIVGDNNYASRTLNLYGKASQNSFVFFEDGTIDGMMLDLQKVEGYSGYNIDECAAEMMISIRDNKKQANMNIISSYLM